MDQDTSAKEKGMTLGGRRENIPENPNVIRVDLGF